MNIYVDESGNFIPSAPNKDAWCLTAAYISTESSNQKLDELIMEINDEHGKEREVKLSKLNEERYFKFLEDLERLDGALFACAMNVHHHDARSVERHRKIQAESVVEHKDKCIHESMRTSLEELSDEIKKLPLQLYTQLISQISLFHKILKYAPLYFVQRNPETLGNFRWRIDQKGTKPNAYEKAFLKILPAILQSKSLTDPMIQLVGADYQYFARFELNKENIPDYLLKTYDINVEHGVDIGKIMKEDTRYSDSKETFGIQAADLCASGLRKLLRGGFQDETRAAILLGRNLIGVENRKSPISIQTLDDPPLLDQRTKNIFKLMANTAKNMIKR